MSELATVLIFTALAGIALPAGGFIASVERIKPHWLEREFRHGVLAFGGGVLLSAVAFVLLPEGMDVLGPVSATTALVAGGICFMVVDRALGRSGVSAANFLAAMLDFVPEALALGALFVNQPRLGSLLAAFIALQNMPEGFNAYRELLQSREFGHGRAILLLGAAAVVGPLCGALGYWLLADLAWLTGVVMVFASGGILYLIFQDIAPQARLDRHWGPPLGAVLGFAVGLIGAMLFRT